MNTTLLNTLVRIENHHEFGVVVGVLTEITLSHEQYTHGLMFILNGERSVVWCEAEEVREAELGDVITVVENDDLLL